MSYFINLFKFHLNENLSFNQNEGQINVSFSYIFWSSKVIEMVPMFFTLIFICFIQIISKTLQELQKTVPTNLLLKS